MQQHYKKCFAEHRAPSQSHDSTERLAVVVAAVARAWAGPYSRRAVGHRQEEGQTQPQRLQQDDEHPIGPVGQQVLHGAAPPALWTEA